MAWKRQGAYWVQAFVNLVLQQVISSACNEKVHACLVQLEVLSSSYTQQQWTNLVLALGSYWQHISASNDAQQSPGHMGSISIGQEVQQMLTDAVARFCQ